MPLSITEVSDSDARDLMNVYEQCRQTRKATPLSLGMIQQAEEEEDEKDRADGNNANDGTGQRASGLFSGRQRALIGIVRTEEEDIAEDASEDEGKIVRARVMAQCTGKSGGKRLLPPRRKSQSHSGSGEKCSCSCVHRSHMSVTSNYGIFTSPRKLQ